MRTVVCTANRGREYEVTFDSEDRVVLVHGRVYTSMYTSGHLKFYLRTLYRPGQKMSTPVSCAVRAAIRQDEETRASAASENKE
jgi:hypothetical protein